MPRYFVVVFQLKDQGVINRKLSGELWATTASQAEIEAGRYREKLNWAGMEWLLGDWYVVCVIDEKQVKTRKGYRAWWKNRPTKRPIKQPGTLRRSPKQAHVLVRKSELNIRRKV